jgi:hypothetical protein
MKIKKDLHHEKQTFKKNVITIRNNHNGNI